MVRLIPESPDFQDDSERVAWMALRASLNDDHALLHGVRFTDAEAGEVEIDLLVLFPDVGAAVIEVNLDSTSYSASVNVSLQGPCGELLPALLAS